MSVLEVPPAPTDEQEELEELRRAMREVLVVLRLIDKYQAAGTCYTVAVDKAIDRWGHLSPE